MSAKNAEPGACIGTAVGVCLRDSTAVWLTAASLFSWIVAPMGSSGIRR
jgi:hypothetical protein